MGRTNIDIDDDLVQVVMDRYQLPTKRQAVDFALRALVGQPMTPAEVEDMFGSIPDFPTIHDTGPA
jgi:Arc/MetJ family transcription regulator